MRVEDDVNQVENRDRLTYAAAARRSGRDVKLIHREIARGRLQTIVHIGRTFVSRTSLDALIARDGAREAQGLRSRIAIAVESMVGAPMELEGAQV
jgi:hypothetical protein